MVSGYQVTQPSRIIIIVILDVHKVDEYFSQLYGAFTSCK